MGNSSPTVVESVGVVAPHERRRRLPPSQAERERRKAFGIKYGGIMRQIKLDRERSNA